MKKNILKTLVIAILAIVLLAPMVSAYETTDYTVEIPEGFTKNEGEGGVTFIDEKNEIIFGVVELPAEEATEDSFYTEEIMESMRVAANEYFNSALIESFEKDEAGNPTGVKYMGESGQNAEIKTFTKNNYKCIIISRGIILKEENATDDEAVIFALKYIYTLHNGKLYGIVSCVESTEEKLAIVDGIINSFTFKEPVAKEEPKAEEPAAEPEDTTKANEKLPKTNVVPFEAIAITLIAIGGVLLVVNNKRK